MAANVMYCPMEPHGLLGPVERWRLPMRIHMFRRIAVQPSKDLNADQHFPALLPNVEVPEEQCLSANLSKSSPSNRTACHRPRRLHSAQSITVQHASLTTYLSR